MWHRSRYNNTRYKYITWVIYVHIIGMCVCILYTHAHPISTKIFLLPTTRNISAKCFEYLRLHCPRARRVQFFEPVQERTLFRRSKVILESGKIMLPVLHRVSLGKKVKRTEYYYSAYNFSFA